MNSLVSIIMPLYNAERFVAQSIESVLAQSYTDWELLICDDHSSDNSAHIAQYYAQKDKRIKLFESEKNQGSSKCRDFLMQQSEGLLLAFLDSDDVWMTKKLEKQVAFMLENDHAFSYTQYEAVNENGKHKTTVKTANAIDYKKYLHNTIIGCSTVMIDKSKLQALPILGETTGDDMALWILVLKQVGHAYPLKETLSQYRIREGSLSSDKLKAARTVWHVYRQNEHLNIVQAATCFAGYAFHALKKRIC